MSTTRRRAPVTAPPTLTQQATAAAQRAAILATRYGANSLVAISARAVQSKTDAAVAAQKRVDNILALPIGIDQFRQLDALMAERYGDANLWTPYHY